MEQHNYIFIQIIFDFNVYMFREVSLYYTYHIIRYLNIEFDINGFKCLTGTLLSNCFHYYISSAKCQVQFTKKQTISSNAKGSSNTNNTILHRSFFIISEKCDYTQVELRFEKK